MVKVVRNDRVFTPEDFTNGGPRAGHYSQWGGGWDDAFQFNLPGRYRIEIKTDKAYFQNGAWPQYAFTVEPLHESICRFDRPGEMTTYRWVDVPEAGRHRVGLRIINNSFHEPFTHGDGSWMTDRGVTLVSVRAINLPPRPQGDAKPFAVQVSPKSASAAPGMPLRLSADVLDEWGQPCGEKVRWAVPDGATVSPDGVFTTTKPGTYTVAASAGQVADSTAICVRGGAWTESFTGQWPDGWRAAGTPSLTCRWWLLDLSPARNSKEPCMAWYEPGVGWTDYSFQADLAAAAEHYQLASARSLLVRFTDERNHYRFDESPGKEKGTATWRLVKVLAGQETELASAQGAPPPATELAGEQGLARVTAKWAFVKDDHQFRGDYWNSIEEKHRQAVDAADAACWKRLGERTRADLAKHPLQISRYAVEVQGDHIVCRVNGRDVLSARDSDLKAGTIGFRCQGGGVRWDDLVVAPMRQAR